MALDNIIYAEGLFVNSDTHGNPISDRNSLRYCDENNLVYLHGGDRNNDYGFQEEVRRLGYKFENEHMIEFFQEDLGQADFETFITIQQLQAYGGIDNLLKLVPEDQREQARAQLEETIKTAQTDELLAKRIEVSQNKFIREKREQVLEDKIMINAIYDVFMEEEAKRFAEELNEYSNVTVLYTLGNHEQSVFVERVRQYLDNKDQIVDLVHTKGYVRVEDSEGNQTTVGGTTNCPQPMPYLREAVIDQAMYELYTSHMAPDGEKARIKDGEIDDLDILISHGQIGKPMFEDGRQGYEVPYSQDVKELSLEAKLTIESHIHAKYDGKNEFGRDMIRAAGKESAIVRKNGTNLDVSWVELDDNFNGNHSNPIPYNMTELEERARPIAAEYKRLIEEALAQEEKIAA